MPTMRMPWSKSGNLQLDLLDAPAASEAATAPPVVPGAAARLPSMVPTASLYEDANNPRTEIPDAELDELADDIRQHGILQPIVVHPADAARRHQIHFGAKRWRSAQRFSPVRLVRFTNSLIRIAKTKMWADGTPAQVRWIGSVQRQSEMTRGKARCRSSG